MPVEERQAQAAADAVAAVAPQTLTPPSMPNLGQEQSGARPSRSKKRRASVPGGSGEERVPPGPRPVESEGGSVAKPGAASPKATVDAETKQTASTGAPEDQPEAPSADPEATAEAGASGK